MKLGDAVAWDRVLPKVRPRRHTNGTWEARGPHLAIPEVSRFDLGSGPVGTTAGLGMSPNSSGTSPGLSRGKGGWEAWGIHHEEQGTILNGAVSGQCWDRFGIPEGRPASAPQYLLCNSQTAFTSTRSNSVTTARQSECCSETSPSRPHGIPSTSPCRVWHHHGKPKTLSMDCVGPL